MGTPFSEMGEGAEGGGGNLGVDSLEKEVKSGVDYINAGLGLSDTLEPRFYKQQEWTAPWFFASPCLAQAWPESAGLGGCHLAQRCLLVFLSAETLTLLWAVLLLSFPQASH